MIKSIDIGLIAALLLLLVVKVLAVMPEFGLPIVLLGGLAAGRAFAARERDAARPSRDGA